MRTATHSSPPPQQDGDGSDAPVLEDREANGPEEREDHAVADTNASSGGDGGAAADTPPSPSDEPSSKRRKLSSSTHARANANAGMAGTPQSQRAVSPPWKKVGVEGPTSFFDGGKRKSARTNAVPLELQPPSSQRRTRASNQSAASSSAVKSKYGNLYQASPAATRSANATPTAGARQKAQQQQAHQQHRRLSRSTPKSAPQAGHTRTGSRGKVQVLESPSKKSRRVSATTTTPVKKEVEDDDTPRRRSTRPRRRSSILIKQEEVEQELANARRTSRSLRRREATSDQEEEEPEEEDEDTATAEAETPSWDTPTPDPDFKYQRLNFKVRVPSLTAQHPLNIPAPKKYPSFADWIHTAQPFAEEVNPRFDDAQVEREAEIRETLLAAAQPGGILDSPQTLEAPEPEEEPARRYFMRDHMLAHAVDLQRRMAQERRRLARQAKKLAEDCAAAWAARQPKTAEEVRRERERAAEARARAVARQVVADLAAKWQLVGAEIERRRLARWEREEEERNTRKLTRFVEKKERLTMERRARGEGSGSEDDSEESEGEEDDESNMSSEDESDGEEGLDDDANLTIEQLQEKYAKPLEQKQETSDVEMEEGETPQIMTESEAEPRLKRLKREDGEVMEMDDSMLDETDESTDMGDDMGSSDQGEEDDEQDEDADDMTGSLLGFLPKKEIEADDEKASTTSRDGDAPKDEPESKAKAEEAEVKHTTEKGPESPPKSIFDQDKSSRRSVKDETVEMDDTMLDETDESTDMDDDMGSSDEGSEGSEGDDEESEDEDSGRTLLGFFSKDELGVQVKEEDDEAAEPVVDEKAEAETEPKAKIVEVKETRAELPAESIVEINDTAEEPKANDIVEIEENQETEEQVEGKDEAQDKPQEAKLSVITQSETPQPDSVEKPTENRHQDEEEEDIEEVSLIPDGTQVLTPAASNGEAPPMSFRKDQDTAPVGPSHLREASAAEEEKPEPIKEIEPTEEPKSTNPESPPDTPQSSAMIKTPVPSLLRGKLREYQHHGLDWLAGLYAQNENGILADEMGLGKTIQTIALLAHVAVEHEIWGPHLIVVPTSVMLNWEMEFKKFLPGFKILTYYGTQEERKQKRKGWLDDDKWNVVITSYQLVLHDAVSFKKRGWYYLVLDEAHNIKNFRSQRWQTLLNFRTERRLLLTGTPLQNNLSELWSLMFFITPHGDDAFADLPLFHKWFNKPADQILEQGRESLDDEAKEIIQRLHSLLRPHLLRRLKADVEKQMPAKYEHVVYCKLSKRQRYLYDGFMSRASTRETLAGGNYLSIINCLMQLRKVCNHPDLFETRPVVTSYAMPRSAIAEFEIKDMLIRRRLLKDDAWSKVSLDVVDLLPGSNENDSALDTIQPSRLGAIAKFRQLVYELDKRVEKAMGYDGSTAKSTLDYMRNCATSAAKDQLHHQVYLTSLRSQRRPLISPSLVEKLTLDLKPTGGLKRPAQRNKLTQWMHNFSPVMNDMIVDLPRRADELKTTIEKFGFVTPTVTAPGISKAAVSPEVFQIVARSTRRLAKQHYVDPYHEARMRLSIAFPDKRLLQWDCGKLQKLDVLLRQLREGGHRALIFTQMTKVLDILEQFLNIHGHRYLRLDGSTKVEQRQILTDRFNNDNRILAFILSSRSGGLGINLTGADTVIFYDLDWNPAMDKQCQDRCHRIGQTRDVHIYRFVSEYTIEANILRKSNQKRRLDDVIIQEGEFTTEAFNRITAAGAEDEAAEEEDSKREADAEASAAMDRVLGTAVPEKSAEASDAASKPVDRRLLAQVEDAEDRTAAKEAEREVRNIDDADFAEKPSGPAAAAAAARKPSVAGGTSTPQTPVDAAAAAAQADMDDEQAEEDADKALLTGLVLPRTQMEAEVLLPRSQALQVKREREARQKALQPAAAAPGPNPLAPGAPAATPFALGAVPDPVQQEADDLLAVGRQVVLGVDRFMVAHCVWAIGDAVFVPPEERLRAGKRKSVGAAGAAGKPKGAAKKRRWGTAF